MAASSKRKGPFFRPYQSEKINHSYNLLFCDRWEMFLPEENLAGDWRPVVFGEPFDLHQVQSLAYDESAESRVRFLAFGRLRRKKIAILPKIILGVIVESPQEKGLNTLAGFADGRVRYFNQVEDAILIEAHPPAACTAAHSLIRASQSLVDRIGPTTQPRRPPPSLGTMRLTFLASDGTYTADGGYQAIMAEDLARPVMEAALVLMEEVTKVAAAGGAQVG